MSLECLCAHWNKNSEKSSKICGWPSRKYPGLVWPGLDLVHSWSSQLRPSNTNNESQLHGLRRTPTPILHFQKAFAKHSPTPLLPHLLLLSRSSRGGRPALKRTISAITTVGWTFLAIITVLLLMRGLSEFTHGHKASLMILRLPWNKCQIFLGLIFQGVTQEETSVRMCCASK